MAKGGSKSSGKSASGKTSVTVLPPVMIKPNSALNKLANSDLLDDQFRCVICGNTIRFSPSDPETSEAEINSSTHKLCWVRSIQNSMPMMNQPQQQQVQHAQTQQDVPQQASAQPQMQQMPQMHAPMQMPWSQDIQQAVQGKPAKAGKAK